MCGSNLRKNSSGLWFKANWNSFIPAGKLGSIFFQAYSLFSLVRIVSRHPHSNGYWQDILFMSYDIPGTLQGYLAGYPIGRKWQYSWDVHSTSSDIL